MEVSGELTALSLGGGDKAYRQTTPQVQMSTLLEGFEKYNYFFVQLMANLLG